MVRRNFLSGLVAFLLLVSGCNDGKKIDNPPQNSTPTRRALLIGINAYPEPATLAGCVNDSHDFRDLLKTHYGYKDDEILIINDKNATTAEIWVGLKWLTAGANAGDKRFFSYSGHGAEFVSQYGVVHQIICPVDFDWSEAHMIKDIEFKEHFQKMPDGVIFNWVSDSCNSGGLTRAVKKGTPKVWPIVRRDMLQKIAQAKSRYKGLVGGILDVGFIPGCESNQTSADTVQGNRPRGALTWYFIDALAVDRDAPLDHVVDRTRDTLHRDMYEQSPFADGAQRERPFQK